MSRRLAVLSAWADTRLAMRLDADGLARRRARLWKAMTPVIERTPALTPYAGAEIRDIPVVDPHVVRADMHSWNSAGITSREAIAAARDAEGGGRGMVRDGIAAGLSTGTAGKRGIFLASERERARYVGQSLARMLPVHAPLSGARIALVLRANSELYRDAGGGRFAFLHLPLGMTGKEMLADLHAFGPTVLIAPPRELAAMAQASVDMPESLSRVFWGSEPMARRERQWITSQFGIRPDPIYQATEGFLGAPCSHGFLHLNEDSLDIQLEPVPGTGCYRPIVTDLRRHVQPIVRVRMDDVVEPVEGVCPCGFAGRRIHPVAGRVQDLWHVNGDIAMPDEIDDMMVNTLGPSARWRLEGSPDRIEATLTDERHVLSVQSMARRLFPEMRLVTKVLPDIAGSKRRRVTWREKR